MRVLQHRRQAAQVGLGRAHACRRRVVRLLHLLKLLSRHGAVSREEAPPLQIGACEREHTLHLRQLCARLKHTLLQLGDIDVGQDLAGANGGSNIRVPPAHIP